MSSSEVAVRRGSCLCGSVRVRISAEPAQKVLCHCLSCKKSGGGVFMANFFCAKDTVEIDDPESAVRGYDDKSCDNGGTVRRSFCSRCGSNVCIVNLTNLAIRDFVIVPMGIMDEDQEEGNQDERASSKPGSEFYVKRRVGWFPGVEGAKEFRGMS